MSLYCTADRVGLANHGGGSVTANEAAALGELDRTVVFDAGVLQCGGEDPWKWDLTARAGVDALANGSSADGTIHAGEYPKLAHFYAGTFTETVRRLKEKGCKVSYTAAAHSVEVSRREHEKVGIPYNYPHLTEPEQLKRYLGGYLEADVLICPSTHSATVMRGFGAKNRIEVIPHGVELPTEIKPLPERFIVGYLGCASAPDKGLVYLLQAWQKLDLKDGWLVIAGHDSQSPYVQQLVRVLGGGNVELRGWVENPSDFYNDISLYVQPSASEGFGLEVLEAFAHSRPVLCSKGAGASDLAPWTVPACDADAMAYRIRDFYKQGSALALMGQQCRKIAESHTWPIIREWYKQMWRSLLP